jgi:cohesin complex subunit SA-1/2
MEVDNPSSPSSTLAEDRRKSGRQTRRPEVFSQTAHSAEINASGKRKRGDAHDNEDHEEDSDESDSDDVGDSEADEEELREKRRAARKTGTKSKKSTAKKGSRSAKKPKVAGNGVRRQLAFRPAALNGGLPASRPRKPKVRPSLAAGERGLFGEIIHPAYSFLSSI